MRSKYASVTEGEIPKNYGVWMGRGVSAFKKKDCPMHNSSSCEGKQFHTHVSLEAVNEWASINHRKTCSGRQKVTLACDDRHLLHMVVNDHTASSRQLAAHWSIATGVLISASSICQYLLHHGLHARLPLCRIPLTAYHRRLHLQWAYEHSA